jgi:phosphoribosylformylglycinamidine synthase
MIYRIDVRTILPARGAEGAGDPIGEALRQQIIEFGTHVGPIQTRRIFLIDTDADEAQVKRIAQELLADPIVEEALVIPPDVIPREAEATRRTSEQVSAHSLQGPSGRFRSLRDDKEKVESGVESRIEIHLKPGVMDPVAASTEMAIRDMGLPVTAVRTGRAYLIEGKLSRAELEQIASKVLANGVIESVHFDTYIPERFEIGKEYQLQVRHIAIRELDEQQLKKLSREGHLFLSLTEMLAIQAYFRGQQREPSDIELETIAQTWSEHCVHKTLKSAVEVCDESGKVLRRYGNLIKETIFRSTQELIEQRKEPFCLSVFKDNAGVVVFDDQDAVCFKVETHNHPSAIEPYGGSATGIGGCIRDILGTGLSAKPVANTDVFCVAYPNQSSEVRGQRSGNGAASSLNSDLRTRTSSVPKGVIHPKRILQQVVAGVRDYGNRMGIPTVNGGVYFDDRYIGNPLVFCGCVGLIPRDKVTKEVKPGDQIVLMGGRTGRDGIHGATFSSAELTDTHASEFSHAVQIGNAITQKKMADVILQARDLGLFNAITDLGAGGLSSAVGEMGEKTGAAVHLETVPLKYAGLRHDEIWISEAQERMALSVPKEKVDELLKLAASEDVEATVIGEFGTSGRELILNYQGTQVGRLSMEFLHDGLPMPTRKAVIRSMGVPPMSPTSTAHGRDGHATLKERLLAHLAHPNIASKHWIIRQYDHEVQGGSVIKPLIGPMQVGPSDAAVVRPKLDSFRGVALSCGMAPHIEDPYDMAIASIDEAIRNAVAVGADPDRMAILDNFCWPSVDDEITMGTLVRACEACHDAALAYGIPFISGKDSLHNQFTNQETGEVIRIPNTLLISAIGVIEDVRKCVTMDLKNRTARVALIVPRDTQPATLAKVHRMVAGQIAAGRIAACHDISDGGIAVAAAEMCIASGMGLIVGAELMMSEAAFAESSGRYLVELRNIEDVQEIRSELAKYAELIEFGLVQHLRKLTITSEKERVMEISIDELTRAWRGTLDW